MRRIGLLVLILIPLLFYNAPHVSAAANAQIQNETTYVDSLGWFHIVGEVLNAGDVWLHYVKITGTLKNSNGQVVDVEFTYAYADYLPARSKSPFDLTVLDKEKSSRIVSYSLVLEFKQATSTLPSSLQVVNTSKSTNSLGWLDVVGEVKNKGSETSNYTKVIATFYDSTGKVIYGGFTYTSPSDIPAGQAYGFKISLLDSTIVSHVASYELFAESNQYTSLQA
jgi:hypothetical protein